MKHALTLFGSALLQHRKAVAGVVALVLLQSATLLLVPWPLKLIIDNLLSDSPWPASLEWLGSLGFGAALLLLVLAVLAFRATNQAAGAALSVITQTTGLAMKLSLAQRLFAHIQRLDQGFHTGSRVGDLTQRVTADCAFLSSLFAGVLLPCLTAVVMLVAATSVLVTLSPLLAGLVLLLVLPVPFVLQRFFSRITERSYRESEEVGGLMALAGQVLSSVQVIKGFNREAQTESTFRAKAEDAVGAALAVKAPTVQANLAVAVLQAASIALVLALGGMLALDGRISIGTLTVAIGYVNAMFGPVGALATVTTTFGVAAGKARRVSAVLDRQSKVRNRSDARDLPPLSRPPDLTFDNVTFGYGGGQRVLDGVSITVRSGETIALTGPTGAGKTTFGALLMRMLDPSKGAVLIDGEDLRSFKLQSLREAMAVVQQESYLIPGTIHDNIALGRPGLSREQVIAAAKAASAHDFILECADGYDTVIGAGGSGLSGGQQQRISIARAVARDAPVLILDEPTSALDAETETSIFDALAAARRGRTTLVIAHRMSTLRLADRILRLEGGKLAEVTKRDVLEGDVA